jgi:hypothetical protein
MELNGVMSRLAKAFNKFIDAWQDLKTARKKMKSGEMCSGEFFDIDWHFDESQREFFKQLDKIK